MKQQISSLRRQMTDNVTIRKCGNLGSALNDWIWHLADFRTNSLEGPLEYHQSEFHS